jgi:ABC-type proline/glycine betaine transport system substrate-binding protein
VRVFIILGSKNASKKWPKVKQALAKMAFPFEKVAEQNPKMKIEQI